MAKQHDKQFKLDAVQYYQDHKDLGVRGCAENLGIGYSTLTKWLKDFRESGDYERKNKNIMKEEEYEIDIGKIQSFLSSAIVDISGYIKPYSVKLTIVLHPVFSAIIPAGNRFSQYILFHPSG